MSRRRKKTHNRREDLERQISVGCAEDTDMRCDNPAGLQPCAMCGNTYVYQSSGTDTDTRGPGDTRDPKPERRGYAGIRETRVSDNKDDLRGTADPYGEEES